MEIENSVYLGDCLEVLRAVPSGVVDLIVTDPPYNTGSHREDSRGNSYPDAWSSRQEYVIWLGERLMVSWRVLRNGGALYVMQDPSCSHYVKVACDQLFGEEAFVREIIWRVGWISGYKTKGVWPRNHDTILMYKKGNRLRCHTPIRGWDASGHLSKHYPRRQKSIVDDVWLDIDSINVKSFIQSVYPTQKPVALFERMILASSNPGDLILDPFCGSGTTGVAAMKTNRKFLLVDDNSQAVVATMGRLSQGSVDES